MLRSHRIKARFPLIKTRGLMIDGHLLIENAQNGQEKNDLACKNIKMTDTGNKTPLTCWEL